MKNLLSLVTILALLTNLQTATAQNTTLQWVRSIGSSLNDAIQDEISTDRNSNFYIRINLGSNADIDPGPNVVVATPGFYLIKYDADGNFIWYIQCPGRFTTDANGNSYMSGRFNSSFDFDPGPGVINISSTFDDLCIAKYSPAGALLWVNDLKGADNTTSFQNSGIIVDDNGDPYITGYINGSIDFDPTGGSATISGTSTNNYFLAAYTSAGGYKWSFKIDVQNTNTDLPKIAFGNDRIYLFGLVSGNSDIDPGSGTTSITGNSNGANSFVAWYSRDNGDYLAGFGYASTSYYNRANRVSVDSLGNFLVSGYYGGPIDLDPGAGTNVVMGSGEYLAKYSVDGSFLWGQHVLPTGYNAFTPFSMSVDPDNNILLSGADYQADSFKIAIVKYNADGAATWDFKLNHFGGHDFASGVLTDQAGNFYIAGVFDGTLDFDPGAGSTTRTSVGMQDGFFAKYIDNTSTLPVHLLNFSGEARGKENILYWTTASEQNSKGFDIERSVGGGVFTSIGFVSTSAVNGNSNVNLKYAFRDAGYTTGANFYRLKQIDNNGKFVYSKTLSLRNNLVATSGTSVYPNPVKDLLNVKLRSSGDNRAVLTVTDISGRLLINQVSNINTGEKVIPLDVSSLSPGVYFLKLTYSKESDYSIMKFEKK